MPPRPAHKRAADSRAESSAAGAHKKTRFAEPADDPATFAEQVDAALEEPGARSTRRVRTDGYDSDSSDSADEGAPSAPGAAKDADVDDMFAVPDEDAAAAAAAPKKKEEFLRLGDIEGQEFVDEDEDEEDEEDEPEDEDDAERRKKAGMGFELSSFNMREEMEEGKFTEDGMYVRTVDRHGVHDKWMDGIDEKEVKQARRRKREREKAERERQRAEEKELEDMGGKEQLERDLLTLLKKGETVLEALQRLGAQAKKSQKLEKGKPKRDPPPPTMDVDKPSSKSFSPIEHVTHIASMLMSLGDTDIYTRTYEELVRSVRSAGKVPRDWDPPSADVRYEYRWDVPEAATGEQVFGPYGEEEMKAWAEADYFGQANEKVKVRTVGGQWGAWDDVVL